MAHAAHSTQNYRIAAGGVVAVVWWQKLAADAAVAQAKIQEASGLLSVRENVNLGLFESPQEQAQCLEAPATVAFEQLAGEGYRKNGIPLVVREVKVRESFDEARLATGKGQGLADSVAEIAVLEHAGKKPLGKHSPQRAPRLWSKGLVFLLVLGNALEHAFAADVEILANGAVSDLALLVALNGRG